ncbi:MAG: NAD-dependent epimerase/dehydratase family protein [Gammaproteobacteria bacterium]|nr:NAD-dependent epimerase/dehydratase family protein [Gammaproteobacteria bacterium]
MAQEQGPRSSGSAASAEAPSSSGTGEADKPLVLITGAAGNLGRSVGAALSDAYRIVGLDRESADTEFPVLEADLTSDESTERALARIRSEHGERIASVIHLIAYFDFTGEPNPLYQSVNVDGTRRLLRGLERFHVEQFVYASTMLVHAPCRPGERIDESQPLAPSWEYPKSKAAAEEVIAAEHGDIPYVLLRFAGVYDERSTVPTMAQQMARIYERDFESYFYSGSTLVGQSMLHRDDMLDAVRRTVDRRHELPPKSEILIGEPDPVGYDALQDELGYLIHGVEDWPTLRMPKRLAAAGVWAQDKLEPVIPDAIDQGEGSTVKPFMVRMGDDHYALDIGRARELLGWEPRHRLKDDLPDMVATLKRDPAAWYRAHKLTPPAWIAEAAELGERTGDLAQRYAAVVRRELRSSRWAHLANMALGTWLLTQPPLIGVENPMLAWTEVVLGAALIVFASLSLSWRWQWARWICAGIGALVMAAPFLLWTTNAAAYLSDTLVGALVFGFAVGTKPDIGPTPLAALTGPEVPPGWTYNPSTWTQRLPIIFLALVGLYVSRYLAAYQLGHVETVWEPFFAGDPADPRNGTEEIITSYVSEAWPVSDAAVGGYTYVLEVLTGIVGSRMRWRTMPWLVVLFGLMIAPLGIVSIFFIIIQPILIGTWSTLALIGAAAMLVQIPYSLDELLAALQFVRRRMRAGQNGLRVFLFGDTDDVPAGGPERTADELAQRPGVLIKDMLAGGVNLPWNLVVAALIGLSLLFTRLTVGADGDLAHAHHLIGALVLTVTSIAAAEVTRAARYLNVPLGAALVLVPLIYPGDALAIAVSVASGLAIAALSLRRGPIRGRYAGWERWIR